MSLEAYATYQQGREERVGSSGWVGALSQLVGFIEATRVGIPSVKSEHYEGSAHQYKSHLGTYTYIGK